MPLASGWRSSAQCLHPTCVLLMVLLLLFLLGDCCVPSGNFGFGIEEHIDLGIKYDPSTGIYGMDFYVCLTRPGRRVQRRKYKARRLGVQHKVHKDDAIAWFEQTFDGIVSGKRR